MVWDPRTYYGACFPLLLRISHVIEFIGLVLLWTGVLEFIGALIVLLALNPERGPFTGVLLLVLPRNGTYGSPSR